MVVIVKYIKLSVLLLNNICELSSRVTFLKENQKKFFKMWFTKQTTINFTLNQLIN
jgi:hypothetical protein